MWIENRAEQYGLHVELDDDPRGNIVRYFVK
jgi:hypothetical protein